MRRSLPVSLRLLFATFFVLSFPLAAQPPDDLELQLVAGSFSSPLAVRHAGDGSGRLFVVERDGRIRIIDGGSVLPSPFLDIDPLVLSGGEQGLLGLAFHPAYAKNGFFYVNYTRAASPDDQTVIERYTVSGNPNVADPDSGMEVIVIDQDFGNHNGGDIHFGPDGYLYIGMGDGGSGGDPFGRAQDLDELLGKMLRLDVDGGMPYAIPPSNPFVGIAGRDEIWAYGLRNPWRFSFDRGTGDLLIGDVGQNAWEEIDFQPAASAGGENYGWNLCEGTNPFSGGADCSDPGLTGPILEYDHPTGFSVTGGFRYRGTAVSGFQGTYVYADYVTNRMWFATETSPGSWTTEEWAGNTVTSVASFGEDEDGELYAVSLSGSVYRFVSPSLIFADGFESGNTSAWSDSVP